MRDYLLISGVHSRPCHKVLRIREGTVLEPWQEVTLSDLIFVIYLCSHGLRVVDVQRITSISKRNLIKLFQRLRESCSNQLLRNPATLGGNNQNLVVQIDESQMHHIQRVNFIERG